MQKFAFVDKHRLSMQVGDQTCKKHACNMYMFQLSFHFCMPQLVVGQLNLLTFFAKLPHVKFFVCKLVDAIAYNF